MFKNLSENFRKNKIPQIDIESAIDAEDIIGS